jgi:hypothetical protein
LFSAVAARDPDAMSATGAKLLEGMRGTQSAASEYAFIAAVAGHACRGRMQEADKLYEQGTHNWVRSGQHAVELRYLYFLSHDAAAQHPGGAGCVTASR